MDVMVSEETIEFKLSVKDFKLVYSWVEDLGVDGEIVKRLEEHRKKLVKAGLWI